MSQHVWECFAVIGWDTLRGPVCDWWMRLVSFDDGLTLHGKELQKKYLEETLIWLFLSFFLLPPPIPPFLTDLSCTLTSPSGSLHIPSSTHATYHFFPLSIPLLMFHSFIPSFTHPFLPTFTHLYIHSFFHPSHLLFFPPPQPFQLSFLSPQLSPSAAPHPSLFLLPLLLLFLLLLPWKAPLMCVLHVRLTNSEKQGTRAEKWHQKI